jgi:23S rRNA pseudouridine2605 synthase
MRLQRALARAGVASRRGAEALISAGRVRVNGTVAGVGQTVAPATDAITVDGRRVRPVETAWIALNKPPGYVVTKRDTAGRSTVFELVPDLPGLTYVGRLDVATSGLLLLTTDGEAAHRLTHPRYAVERAYRVIVHGRPTDHIRRALQQPIVVDGRRVSIVRYRVRRMGRGASDVMLVLTEGRNRIVRRTCEQLGLVVDRLTRLSHGPVKLGRLAPGKWRYLSASEIRSIDTGSLTKNS